MESYDSLETFNLASHGDHWEQQFASFVIDHFPAYEVFWRRYVVPLTNRIDPMYSLSADRDQWIRARSDINDASEQMTMYHYSVLYFLARAHERIYSETIQFPEDVFSLLDACGDNVLHFFQGMRVILKDFDRPGNFLPGDKNQLRSLGGVAFLEIGEYRDLILHNAVLGRAVGSGRELLPQKEFLEAVRLSWRRAASLTSGQFVDSRDLYRRLHAGVTNFLQEKWQKIVSELDVARDRSGPKFRAQWSLERFPSMLKAPLIVQASQPLAASGASWSPVTSSAVIVRNRSEEPFRGEDAPDSKLK